MKLPHSFLFALLFTVFVQFFFVPSAFAFRQVETSEAVYPLGITLFQSTRYLLADISFSCDDTDQCKIYSGGYHVQNSWYPGTQFARIPYNLHFEYFEGNTLKATTTVVIPACASCTLNSRSGNFKIYNGDLEYFDIGTGKIVRVAGFDVINGLSHMKIWAETGYTDNTVTAKFPIIDSIIMSFGVGLESTTTDPLFSLPTVSQFSYATSTDTYSMVATVKSRSNGASIQSIEVSEFTCGRKRVQTNVNMQNYTKYLTYSAGQMPNATIIATVDPSTTGTTFGHCVIKGSEMDSFLYGMGTYVVSPRVFDHENIGTVTGAVYSPHMVRAQYNAPSSIGASVSTSTKKVTVTWVKPTRLSNGTVIDVSNFKGYLVYVKNKTTGQLAYAFGVNSGHNTTQYVTPIALAAGTYEVSVCGWSMQNDEGKCRASTQSVIVP